MIAPKKSTYASFNRAAGRALKRAVTKVQREAAKQGTKLAVWQDGAARLVSLPKGKPARGRSL